MDYLDGGEGNDTANYEGSFIARDGLVIDLVAGTVDDQVRLTSIENVRGTFSSDIITGTDGQNLLFGLSGNDQLNGGAGDDRLSGENGATTRSAAATAMTGSTAATVTTASMAVPATTSSTTTRPWILDGGAGIDTADFHLYNQNVYLDLQTGIGGGGGNISWCRSRTWSAPTSTWIP